MTAEILAADDTTVRPVRRVTRIARLIVGALVPPGFGGCLFLFSTGALERDVGSLMALPLMLPLAYVAAGLQAIAYSLLMEFLVRRLFGTGVVSVALGGCLGALAGLSFFAGTLKEHLTTFVWSGVLAGIATALVLCRIGKVGANDDSPLPRL